MVLAHSPVHLFPFDALLALAERRLALYHLEDQAAQAPPVRAEGVALVLDHFRSYAEETSDHVNGEPKNRFAYVDFKVIQEWLPMYPTVPTRPRIVSPSGI